MEVKLLIIPVAGYILGSIPFSYLVTRLKTGGDIRNMGSRNVGATNVLRTSGKMAGLAALMLDVCKGAAAVAVARALTTEDAWAGIAGFSAAAGHSFPLFLRFRGGKSVATGAGAFMMLSFPGILCSLATFGLILFLFRIVSLGSIAASAAFPLFAWIFGAKRGIILWGAATAVLIILRHHANVVRLIRRIEERIDEKSN